MQRWYSRDYPSNLHPILSSTEQALIQPHRNPMHVAVWLLIICAMIYCAIAIGGYTRLTDSGLSMVDWHPVSGVLPPLSQTQWIAEFEHYQQFPEYQTVNSDLSLEGFKRIFWIEYAHRIAGRLVALAFLLPFIIFQLRGYLSIAMSLRLIAVFLAGALQGWLGWFMVQSGMVNDPSVSQYKLTAHLSLAVLIYSYVLWLSIGLICGKLRLKLDGSNRLFAGFSFCIALVVIMLVSGGFMSGTRAGFVVNTFPHMNGEWIPDMLFSLTPLWANLFENVIAIQFIHRWVAFAVVGVITILWFQRFSMNRSATRVMLDIVMVVAICQFCLGVATLVSRVQLPVALAHQSGFVMLLSALIIMLRLIVTGQRDGTMHTDRIVGS